MLPTGSRSWLPGLVVFAAFFAPCLRAQYAAPPNAYSVTETNSMMGAAVNMEIYRNGDRVVADQTAKSLRTRTYYNLASGTTYTWNPTLAGASCNIGRFSGDWGDPFAASGQLAALHPKETGAGSVVGLAAKSFQVTVPGQSDPAKAWVEAKHGMLLKLEMSGATVIEVQQASFTAPPENLLALPAAPGASCTVLLRIVRAGAMTPITAGFQVAADLAVDFDHPASYRMGAAPDGRMTFSGGSLKELTGQLRNGVLRIENAPEKFDMELAFQHGISVSALIYRQCPAPESVLLYVVKNPAGMSETNAWLWAKSGKYAVLPSSR